MQSIKYVLMHVADVNAAHSIAGCLAQSIATSIPLSSTRDGPAGHETIQQAN